MKTSIRVSDAIALVLARLPLSRFAQDVKPAQPANGSKEELVEEVIVTGYRASLRDALEVKRASLGVVEAISSKDIAVLPDVTIAKRSRGCLVSTRFAIAATTRKPPSAVWMIDAQSIVVASTATRWYGHESEILRYVFFHSVALALMVSLLVLGQAYVWPLTELLP